MPLQAPKLCSMAGHRPVLVKLLKINDIKVYYFQPITWKRIHRHAESGIGNQLSVLFSIRYLSPDPPPPGKIP